MEIIITQKQFDNVCLTDKCVSELKTLLNNIGTKSIFRNPIDLMLNRHKINLNKNSKQFKKDGNVLKRYFNFSNDEIDKLMSIKMIYDDNGDWMPINKLNTNYSDLSVLVVDILVGEGECICKIIEDFKQSDKTVILDLANRMVEDPEYFYQTYLKGNFDKYVENNRRNTLKGNESEMLVVNELIKLGYKLIFMADEGSPIDTKLSVDIIMEKNGEFFKFQVKSVGSITKINQTPCDVSNPGIKEPGGFKIFKKSKIYFNDSFIDYLVFVAPKNKMLVMRRYQPVTIDSIKPLACSSKSINQFPANNIYIDHESVVHRNF